MNPHRLATRAALTLGFATLTATASDLVWNTAGPTNTWNAADLNWTPNQAFVSGDNVSFTSASGESVAVLAGGLTVGTMTVSNTTSSYTFTGGTITGTSLIKSGAAGLRFDNATSFTSISASAGPYSQTDGAFRLGNANALGTAPITFTNTANMTGLYFLTGFGTASTLSNNIAFTTSAVTTRLVGTSALNLPTGQIVTLSGVLSGGSSTSIVQTDSSVSAGVSRIKLTNASNTVQLLRWQLNRGGLEFTSDAALGNAANGLYLDVTSANSGTGLIFGASNISLASTRAVTVQSSTVIDTQAFTGSQINGAVTMTGLIYKQGSTTLTFNGAGTGTGGIRIDAGTVQVGSGGTTGTIGTGAVAFNASGTNLTFNRSDAIAFSGAVTGTGSLTKKGAGTLTLSGTNTYSEGTTVDAGVISIGAATNIGSGPVSFSAVGTGLTLTGTAITLANNISLPTSGSGNVTLLTPNSSSTISSGIIGGGGANTVLFFQGGGTSQNTGALTLNGTNTFTGAINIQRGPLILGNSSAAGTAKIIIDSNNPAAGALQLGNFTISNNVVLTGSASVGVATGNSATITGIISQTAATPLVKVGDGSLTLSGNNTYAGGTNVNAGTLVAGSSTAFGTGNITVGASGILNLNGQTIANSITNNGSVLGTASVSGIVQGSATFTGAVNVTSGGLVKGTPTFTGGLTLGTGSTLSPGNSPGTVTSNSVTWSGTVAYVWELNLAGGAAGTNWDLLNVNGLPGTLDATALTTLNVSVVSLTNLNAAGLVSDFNTNSPYTWTIVSTANGITGFNPATVSVNLIGFQNSHAGSWAWSVVQSGDNLNLVYVPEPSTYAALAGLGVLGLAVRRRSRRA